MRSVLVLSLATIFVATQANAAEPLVEQYLRSGQLARGQQAMELAIASAPDNDQLKFELAVLQLVRGVERLGQSLRQYGCRPQHTNAPFVRIPVPENPDPSPITSADYVRMLDRFYADLAAVESTLAGIKADDVSLELRMTAIRMNLTGHGPANDKLVDLIGKMAGGRMKIPADNPEFLIRFDRGDVAWLRAYCHLLMGMIDFNLAFDPDELFVGWGPLFAQPKGVQRSPENLGTAIAITDPARLDHFRRHLLKVCELNVETWKFIRQETDNDHEWLPNPRQTGVLQVPITDEMIDAWLKMVKEIEALLNGTKVIPRMLVQFISPKSTKGVNLRTFLEDPPEVVDVSRMNRQGIRDKYLDSKPDMDVQAVIGFFFMFQDSFSVGYAVWFN